MTGQFKLPERVDILEHYLLNKKSPIAAARALRNVWEKPHLAIARTVFARVYATFKQFGTVVRPRKRERPTRSVENIEMVRRIATDASGNDESLSTRRIVAQTNISLTSLWRILRKDLKLKPYRLKLVHKLNEDDYDRRMEFCEVFLEFDAQDDSWKDKIFYTDEANFHLSGAVNRHNCVFWESQNRHRKAEVDGIGTQKVMVWAGISSGHRVGPYFFDGSVNAERYLLMLTELIPSMEEWDDFNDVIFQHDGAQAHFARTVRDFLDDKFETWIGRRGTIEWPARSPDLTPPDFFLWGYLKDKVYGRAPKTIPELKRAITEEFHDIPQELITRACQSVKERCQLCIRIEGRQLKLHKESPLRF